MFKSSVTQWCVFVCDTAEHKLQSMGEENLKGDQWREPLRVSPIKVVLDLYL